MNTPQLPPTLAPGLLYACPRCGKPNLRRSTLARHRCNGTRHHPAPEFGDHSRALTAEELTAALAQPQPSQLALV